MPILPVVLRAVQSASYPKWLLAAFVGWFAMWAIRPKHPQDFFLEHALTVLFAAIFCRSFRRFRLSNVSYTTLFLFAALHVVGAHYTYSEVPYAKWAAELAGAVGADDFDLHRLLGWNRNHYDRLVHFSFGLLMAYPVREVFVRVAKVRGFWAYYLPLDVVMSLSMLYELLEWGVAVIVGGDVGDSYLGSQGDVWDAQKDMALATLGGAIAMLCVALVNWKYQRDFAQEFGESLRASPRPLGEVKLCDILADRPQSG